MGDAAVDHRVLIALANASCSFFWHELITSVAANDRNLATTEPLTHRAIGGDPTYLVAIDKIVSLISLSLRQAVLFDQLLDLRVARFLVVQTRFAVAWARRRASRSSVVGTRESRQRLKSAAVSSLIRLP
jgi:hypothetical protein